MAANAGRNLRMKVNTTVVAGAKSDSLKITKGGIDVTDKDDGGVMTFVDIPGTWGMTMSCSGVIKDSVLLLLANDSTSFLATMAIDVDGIGEYSGEFGITNFEVGGESDGEMTFSCEVQSSGTITFTAV